MRLPATLRSTRCSTWGQREAPPPAHPRGHAHLHPSHPAPPHRQARSSNPARAGEAVVSELFHKQRSYRRRSIAAGKCPHCGKQSAPFYECQDRRTYKKIFRILARGAKVGAVVKIKSKGRTTWRFPLNPAAWPAERPLKKRRDKRLLPKFGDKPFKYEKLIVELAVLRRKRQRTFTEAEIARDFAALRISASSKMSHNP